MVISYFNNVKVKMMCILWFLIIVVLICLKINDNVFIIYLMLVLY